MKIGILSGMEMATALVALKKFKNVELAKMVDLDERVFRGVRDGEWDRPCAEGVLSGVFRQNMNVFWSPALDKAIDAIRNDGNIHRVRNMIGPLMSATYESLLQVDVNEIDLDDVDAIDHHPENDYFGRTYQAAYFWSCIARTRHSSIDRIDAATRADALTNKLLEYLALRDEDDTVVILVRFKVVSERLMLKWELTPEDERNSEGWRREIEDYNFFDTYNIYNDLVPRSWEAPWNALSVASRMEMRERYSGLHKRLMSSKKFKSIDEFRKRDSYDADFRDFDDWLMNFSEAAE